MDLYPQEVWLPTNYLGPSFSFPFGLCPGTLPVQRCRRRQLSLLRHIVIHVAIANRTYSVANHVSNIWFIQDPCSLQLAGAKWSAGIGKKWGFSGIPRNSDTKVFATTRNQARAYRHLSPLTLTVFPLLQGSENVAAGNTYLKMHGYM